MADNPNKSTLSPLVWVLRWIWFVPPFIPITMILFWHPSVYKIILASFIKPGSAGYNAFTPFWIRIPPIGLSLMAVGWLLSAFVNALSTLIPFIIWIMMYTWGPVIMMAPIGTAVVVITTAALILSGVKYPTLEELTNNKAFVALRKLQVFEMA